MKKVFLTLLVAILVLAPFKASAQVPPFADCDTGYASRVSGDNASYTIPMPELLTHHIYRIIIRDLNNVCHEFTANEDNACYIVSGIGGPVGQASFLGQAEGCSQIEHVEFYITDGSQPTSSPSPTPRTSPTPTPVATEVPHPQPCNGCGGTPVFHTGSSTPSTGQVLGASTLAATGTQDKLGALVILSIGLALIARFLYGKANSRTASR